jgi:hypothetical protein
MEDKEGGSDSVFVLLFFCPFILATAFHSPAQRAHAATECAARLSIRRSSRVIYRDYTGGADSCTTEALRLRDPGKSPRCERNYVACPCSYWCVCLVRRVGVAGGGTHHAVPMQARGAG